MCWIFNLLGCTIISILLYIVSPCQQLHYCKNGREKNKTHILIMLQFCVTQSHIEQGAIAKKSSLLSQHETPPQLLNATGRSWSCGFQGTEQRMKGNSSHPFLARAACLTNPLLQDTFKPDNIMIYISAEKLSISTKYTKVYIFQCAVGFCLHHISEAEPVEFIIRSELLKSVVHEYLVYFDRSSLFNPSALEIRTEISSIL